MLLVGALERVCVIGRVKETSLSFGLGRGCAVTHEGVAGALDWSMDSSMSGIGNMLTC